MQSTNSPRNYSISCAIPYIHPDPLALGLTPEAQGAIAIVIENVRDLYGIEFHLTFDPNVIQVEDANPAREGVQIEPAAWLQDGFVAVNRADNSRGRRNQCPSPG